MGLKGLELLQASIIAFHFKLRLEQACGYCTPEQPNPNDADSLHSMLTERFHFHAARNRLRYLLALLWRMRIQMRRVPADSTEKKIFESWLRFFHADATDRD